jgi:FKBP-type peptidyl-prolyl cis-trans isomerase
LIISEKVLGSGPAASPGDIVTVKYAGRLQSNGKQFDAGTISFKLGAGKVITGWDQGIAKMQVGGSRKLVIPPELAYGRNGAGGGIIPPNATLEFDVELVGISNGPLAEVLAAAGIGSNPRTVLLLVFFGIISSLLNNLTFPEDM